MTLSLNVREAIRAAYGYRCGYCGVSETQVGGILEVDHFRPLAHGGTDEQENLVYACTACNRFKADYWPLEDLKDSLHLLHPNKDNVHEHLIPSPSGRLQGLTSRGWFHIRRLHLNRPQLIIVRQLAQEQAEFQEAYYQVEQGRVLLEERIRSLERELEQLQEIVARLTK